MKGNHYQVRVSVQSRETQFSNSDFEFQFRNSEFSLEEHQKNYRITYPVNHVVYNFVFTDSIQLVAFV